jgi:hypothetical protein
MSLTTRLITADDIAAVQPLILQLGYELEGRHSVALTATRLSEFDLPWGQVRT